jgi:hypothetical protein
VFAVLGVDALRIKLRARRIFDLRAVFFENCHVLIGQFRRIKLLKRPLDIIGRATVASVKQSCRSTSHHSCEGGGTGFSRE